MRLTQTQIKIIKQVASEVFGPTVRIFLFGSRTDHQQRGGDIDLYISGLKLTSEEALDAKLLFLALITVSATC